MEMAGQIINGYVLFISYFTIIRSLFSKECDSIRRQEKYKRENTHTQSVVINKNSKKCKPQ